MNQQFPLFRSHLDLAHQYWRRVMREGDWAIDATCGNGQDSLALAKMLKKGGLISLDIQEKALEKTRSLLQTHLSQEERLSIHLFQQSHVQFPALADDKPVRVIVYNLGYLPGGDKSVTTQTATTLLSIENALTLLLTGGILSVTCYPGHPEGAREQQALLQKLASLDTQTWNVCHHSFPNRSSAPTLLLIQKS